jgi:long-chain fatty acid transport protein
MTRKVAAVLALVAAFGVVGTTRRAQASGFALDANSVKLLATSYAGRAAWCDDASAGWYNVAGLTRTKQGSFVGTSEGYIVGLDMDVTSSTVYGKPVSGATQIGPGRDAWVPSFHGAWRLNERWVLGLSVTAPFGLEVDYPSDSAVRYIATKSNLLTYNINPNIAYRINDQWSIGVGFNAQFFEAKLEQKIFIPLPVNRDGDLFVKVNDWNWGANAGVLYEPTPDLRFGLSYRSQINFDLSGPAQVSDVPGVGNGRATSSVTTPDVIDLSAFYHVLPNLQLLGDLEWTHWDVFDELVADFSNGLPQYRILEDFRDTWSFGLGANYLVTPEWTLRFGWGFDQSPVTDNNRTVRLPDSNRWLISAGIGYQLVKSLGIDFGYLHAFFDGGTVNETDELPGNANVRGSYFTSGDVVGLQITYNFDHMFEGYEQLRERFGI